MTNHHPLWDISFMNLIRNSMRSLSSSKFSIAIFITRSRNNPARFNFANFCIKKSLGIIETFSTKLISYARYIFSALSAFLGRIIKHWKITPFIVMPRMVVAIAGIFIGTITISYADVGDVTPINTMSPKNYPASFQYITRSTYVFVSTGAFSNNLGPTDITVQHALQTIDQLSISGGGGGSGRVNSGTIGQMTYYAVNGATVSGTSNLINNTSSITINTPLIVNSTTTINAIMNIVSGSTQPSTITSGLTVSGGPLISQSTFTVSGGTISINGTTYFWQAGSGGSGKFLLNNNGVITSSTPAGTGGGSGTPGGSPGQFQFNSTGTFDGSAMLTTNYSTITVTTADISSDTITLDAATTLILQQVTPNTVLGVDANGVVISTTITGSGGSTSPGGGDTNVQINHPDGTFYGDNGFQYDASVSSVTIGTGGLGLFGPLLVDRPDLGTGFVNRSSLSFDPNQQNPSLNLRSYYATNSSVEFIERDNNGNDFLKLTGNPLSSHAFSIRLSSGNGSDFNPLTRWSVSGASGIHAFADSNSHTMVQFDPVGNSSFTLPVYLSTITIKQQLLDKNLSAGTSGYVFTSQGSSAAPLWQPSSGGGGGSTSPAGSDKQLQDNNAGSFGALDYTSATTTGLVLFSTYAPNVPLTITGASSQSGDLLDLKDPSLGLLTAIRSDGGLNLRQDNSVANAYINLLDSTHAGIWFGQASPSSQNYSFLGSGNDPFSGNAASIFFNAPGTTGKMYLRQNNVTYGKIQNGAVIFGNSLNNNTQEGDSNAQVSIDMVGNPAEKALVLKGGSAQSVNLFETQTSAGVVTSSVDVNGVITVSTINVIRNIQVNGNSGTAGQLLQSNGPGVADSWASVSGGSGGSNLYPTTGTPNIQYGFSASTGVFTSSITVAGNVTIGTTTLNQARLFVNTDANTIGLIIRDPSSCQTCGSTGNVDLTQWWNDRNVVMSSVTKDGSFVTASSVTANVIIASTISPAFIGFQPGATPYGLYASGTNNMAIGLPASAQPYISLTAAETTVGGKLTVSGTSAGGRAVNLESSFSLADGSGENIDYTLVDTNLGGTYRAYSGMSMSTTTGKISLNMGSGSTGLLTPTNVPYFTVDVSSFGSTVGFAKLEKSLEIGPKTVSSSYSLAISSSATGIFSVTVSTLGIVSYPANSGLAVSSCGSGSPAVIGSNVGGTITVGGGAPLACTLTFSPPFKNTPLDCVANDDSTTISSSITSLSNMAVTFGFSGVLAGGHIYYHCDGND